MEFETFDSVFDALCGCLSEAEGMEARFELLSALGTCIQSWDITPEAAATRMGIALYMLHDIMRGKLSQFSLDALTDLTNRAEAIPEPITTKR